MKRITYAGGTIETGDDVSDALLGYLTTVSQTESNISVDVPVCEPGGEITMHTLILGPATQLDVTDVRGESSVDEAHSYPVPGLLKATDVARATEVAESEPSEESARAARDFDEAVADIEGNLDLGSHQ